MLTLAGMTTLILSSWAHSAVPQISLSTTTLLPGETLRVQIDGLTSTETLKLSFMDKEFSAYPLTPTSQRVLIGIPLDAVPGPYPLILREEANVPDAEPPLVTVATKTFVTENVNFSKSKTELMKAEHRESVIIGRMKLYLSHDQQWEGKFMYPVDGPVIGIYGLKRLRNGKIHAGFHKGIDLRAPTGTPLLAANSGTVVLAETFIAHGKTVLLNHGQGVMSIYLHMDQLDVKANEKVKKGQALGKVGSTGLATAPHVHFQVYVHGVPVDPAQWVANEF